ncbi:MAG: hypothetical protein RL470_1106 [Actinomycetota bacterium]
MTTIRLSDGIVKDDVLVVGLAAKNSKSTKSGATSLQIESGDLALDTKALVQALSDLGATGKAEEVIKIPGTSTRLIVFTGLGTSASHYDHEVLRRASGAAARALAGNSSATFSLPAKNIAAVKAIAEGAALGAYRFDQFRGLSKSEQQTPLKAITVHTDLAGKSEAKAAIKTAEVIATYTHLVRDLINTPPSHLNPETFCKAMSDAVKKAGGASVGLKVSVMTDSQ